MKLEKKKKVNEKVCAGCWGGGVCGGARLINHCTLRARAETSWCQSRNFVYLGLKT